MGVEQQLREAATTSIDPKEFGHTGGRDTGTQPRSLSPTHTRYPCDYVLTAT